MSPRTRVFCEISNSRMSRFSPAILLAAVFLCTAQISSQRSIAHDRNAHEILQGSLAMQQRQMTSPSSMPSEAVSGNSIQQMNLGRNLLNLGKVQQDDEQRTPPNAKGNKDISVDVHSASSVVENWSLICKQLCGAGRGGELCAVDCVDHRFDSHSADLQGTNRKILGRISTDGLFGKNIEAVCSDLCEVGLGAKTCSCKTDDSNSSGEKSPKTKNEIFDIVCNSFCEHMGTDIQGCTVCEKLSLNDTNNNQLNAISKSGRKTKSQDDTQSTTTTTPNWSKLCSALCRTGDGGSLCNCDLSPFFTRINLYI